MFYLTTYSTHFIYEYSESNNSLSEVQAGFRRGYSVYGPFIPFTLSHTLSEMLSL